MATLGCLCLLMHLLTETIIKSLHLETVKQENLSKTLFIIPTYAHYYKSVEMLKQLESYNTCPDMFRFTQEPSSGSSPVLG
jgi:hypothetical protein